MPSRKRKTSLNNVTSFINNLKDPDTLNKLISILSSRLEYVSSGSSGSEVETEGTLDSIDKYDNVNDSEEEDVFHDITNDTITPSCSSSAAKDSTEMPHISSDAIYNNSISEVCNAPEPVCDNDVDIPGDISTDTVISQGCCLQDQDGENLLNVSVKQPECYDHHSVDFVSTELTAEVIDYFSVNDSQCTKEGGRRVANFGLPYHYNGSKGPNQYVPFPDIIKRLNDTIKKKFPSSNINNVSVSILDGPQSYLPKHSDNESIIKCKKKAQ